MRGLLAHGRKYEFRLAERRPQPLVLDEVLLNRPQPVQDRIALKAIELLSQNRLRVRGLGGLERRVDLKPERRGEPGREPRRVERDQFSARALSFW